jgi:hypothetical protein
LPPLSYTPDSVPCSSDDPPSQPSLPARKTVSASLSLASVAAQPSRFSASAIPKALSSASNDGSNIDGSTALMQHQIFHHSLLDSQVIFCDPLWLSLPN